jgi:UPF0755 protein
MVRELSKNPLVLRFFDDAGRGVAKSFNSFLNGAKKSLTSIYRGARSLSGLDLRHFFVWSAVGLIFLSLLFVAVFFQVGNRWDDKLYTVNIPNGYGVYQVSNLLLDMGIIDNRYSFNLMISMLGLEDRIKAGVYKFSPSMGMGSIVWKLKVGDVISPPLARIVFPEGTSVYRMGLLLKREGLADGEKFKNYIDNAISGDLASRFSFLEKIPTGSLEGYLFPDTYLVPYDISNALFRDMMLSRFSAVIMPLWKKSSADTSMSLHEIVTLASIVEKEAAVEEERAIISSVFHNRLKKRMYLGADPTVKYALSPFRKPTKKVFYIDLEVDSPYNTYKNLGLPPGPICNPGLASVKAAIYPAQTDYLYFVARKDGTHIFSKTWQEHERAKITARGK